MEKGLLKTVPLQRQPLLQNLNVGLCSVKWPYVSCAFWSDIHPHSGTMPIYILIYAESQLYSITPCWLKTTHILSYMFIVPASRCAPGSCHCPYDPWSVEVWLGRWRVEGPHSCCRWVTRTWRPRGASWTNEGGLDQPLEVLVGSDGIETGDKLAATCHSELLKGKRERDRERKKERRRFE